MKHCLATQEIATADGSDDEVIGRNYVRRVLGLAQGDDAQHTTEDQMAAGLQKIANTGGSLAEGSAAANGGLSIVANSSSAAETMLSTMSSDICNLPRKRQKTSHSLDRGSSDMHRAAHSRQSLSLPVRSMIH